MGAIWLERPDETGTRQLPVDWQAITAKSETTTNYQLLPNDRLVVDLVANQQVVLQIQFLQDTTNSLAQFKPLQSGTGWALVKRDTWHAILPVFRQHHLLEVLSSPILATMVGRKAQLSIGDASNRTSLTCVPTLAADGRIRVELATTVARNGQEQSLQTAIEVPPGEAAILKALAADQNGETGPIYVAVIPELVEL